MKKLPVLKPGDFVELIAPASRCSNDLLIQIQELLESWQLNCIIKDDIFGEDLLCANTDDLRSSYLKDSLLNPKSKAIICVRGGYGAMRLIPQLVGFLPPSEPKILVGMSDITCLSLFFEKHWQWPTIHGAAIPDKFSEESLGALKSLLFAEKDSIEFVGLKSLNKPAQEIQTLEATMTGGNLTLVQASIGTDWQIDARNKFILLEEVNERGYRVDRMLEHLRQADVFKGAAAIVLGDFLGGVELDGSTLVPQVLQRFASSCAVPVVQVQGIGHGHTNFPIPLGTKMQLELGADCRLKCYR